MKPFLDTISKHDTAFLCSSVTLHGTTFMLFLTHSSHFNYPYPVSLLDCRFPKEMITPNFHYVPYSIHCSGDAQYIEWINEYMDVCVPILYNSKALHCLSLFYGAIDCSWFYKLNYGRMHCVMLQWHYLL